MKQAVPPLNMAAWSFMVRPYVTVVLVLETSHPYPRTDCMQDWNYDVASPTDNIPFPLLQYGV